MRRTECCECAPRCERDIQFRGVSRCAHRIGKQMIPRHGEPRIAATMTPVELGPGCVAHEVWRANLLRGAAVFILIGSTSATAQTPQTPGAGRRSHQYCVITQGTTGAICKNCTAPIGGEGGKLICRYKVGSGSVKYGGCDEPRNRPPC
jgi:hypothetical protein